MSDTNRIYVNSEDGYWYYYNGNTWVQGELYQAEKIAKDSVNITLLDKRFQNTLLPILDNEITNYEISNHTWYYSTQKHPASDPAITNYFYPVNQGELYYCEGNGAYYNRRGAVFVDESLNCLYQLDLLPRREENTPSALYTKGYMYVDDENIKYLAALSGIKVYKIDYFTIDIDKDSIVEEVEKNITSDRYIPCIDAVDTGLAAWNGTVSIEKKDNNTFDCSLTSDSTRYAGVMFTKHDFLMDYTKKILVYLDFDLKADMKANSQCQIAIHPSTSSGVVGPKNFSQTGLKSGNHIFKLEYENTFNPDINKYNIFFALSSFNDSIDIIINKFIVISDDFEVEDTNKRWSYLLEKYGIKNISNIQSEVEKLSKQIATIDVQSELISCDGESIIFSNEANRIIDEQLKNDFAWKTFDKVYATMTFDDTNNDISTLEKLAEELEIPLCWATIPSKLNNTVADGRKAIEVLKASVARGSEILAHWSPYLQASSSKQDYYNVYVGAKKTLEEAGFEVNGIITAGGGEGPTSYQTQDFDLDTKIARCYYEYADLTSHFKPEVEQFYNKRTFTDSGVQATKNYIDQICAQGHGWINWASHGIQANYIKSIDEFREIWEYAQSKGVEFTTWKTLYDKFKSSKLEKRINNLEN